MARLKSKKSKRCISYDTLNTFPFFERYYKDSFLNKIVAFQRGYRRKQIFLCIDWVLILPEELEEDLWKN
jgi:hypothetical protein